MKVIVLLLLAAIVASLFSGLFFLARDKQDSTRLLRSLKIRVALSIILIAFLVSAFSLGWIRP
ncbi:MAG: twin transmembrane helix small protein [Woeseiaceae bacterium]|nr:twin transmembrane helix small protein [Woeseiaceae bacterium]